MSSREYLRHMHISCSILTKFTQMRNAVGGELGSIRRALTVMIWYFVCFWVTTWEGSLGTRNLGKLGCILHFAI